MTHGEWFALCLGLIGVFSVVAGICARSISELIAAWAERVRAGTKARYEKDPAEPSSPR